MVEKILDKRTPFEKFLDRVKEEHSGLIALPENITNEAGWTVMEMKKIPVRHGLGTPDYSTSKHLNLASLIPEGHHDKIKVEESIYDYKIKYRIT